jgi:hypothetical protein
MVPGPPARYLIPAEWQSKPLSQSFINNLKTDGIELVYTDEFGSGLGKMPNNNFAPRLDAAYQIASKYVARARVRTVLRGLREPRRQSQPRLQLPVPVHLAIPVSERRVAEPAGRWIVADLSSRDRIVLDPVNVNANGLPSGRGIRLQTPRYHKLQRHAADRSHPNHSIEVGYVGTRGRTSRPSPA